MEQLQHWASTQPGDVITVLDELRSERDETLLCLEEWNDMVNKAQRAIDQARRAQDRQQSARRAFTEKQARSATLQDELNTMQERLDNVLEELDQTRLAQAETDRARGTSKNSPTPSTVTGKRSPKHPDPPVFTNGVDPTFDDWSLRIQDKLIVNDDHFPTESVKVIFVISRTESDAADHLTAYRAGGHADYFKTSQSVLDVLQDIYADPDRERNARRNYMRLKQSKKQSFNVFYSEFRKQVSYLGYDEKTLMNDLREKVVLRLKEALSNTTTRFNTIAKLKDHLQTVDNQQRSIEAEKDRASRFIQVANARRVAASSKPVFQPRSFNQPKPAFVSVFNKPGLAPPSASPFNSDLRFIKMLVEGRCFKCEQPGHLTMNCPRSNKPIQDRIQEVDTDSDREQGLADEEQSEHDSENE